MDRSAGDEDDDFFTAFIDAVHRRDEARMAAIIAAHPEHSPALNELIRSAESTSGSDDPEQPPRRKAPSCWDDFAARVRELGSNHLRYEERGTIGRGGIGLVLEVFDSIGKRTLAMKVLRDQYEPAKAKGAPVDDRKIGRFIEESQITGQLDHPGIVPVHEIGIDGQGRVYFTMKRVRGANLHDVFAKVKDGRDGWTATRAVGVLLRVCEAMAYAHAKGVIHRDLKPANVMVGAFGEVFVMDWGLARILDSTAKGSPRGDESATLTSDRMTRAIETPEIPLETLQGEVIGTPAYMPPEQAGGNIERLGPAADVYAVGAMLYEIFAGRAPYADVTISKRPIEAVRLVLAAPPRPLSEVAPHTPPEMIAVTNKAMAREIDDRFESMQLLADDLRAYLENRVVKAYRTGAWAELQQWMRRNRALAATGALGLLASFTLTAIAFIERGRAKVEATRADSSAADAITKTANLLRLADARRLDRLIERGKELQSPLPENVGEFERWLEELDSIAGRRAEHEATLATLRSKSSGTPGAETFASDEDAWWFGALGDLLKKLDLLERDDRYATTRRAIFERLETAKNLRRRSIDDHAADWLVAIAAIADKTVCPKYDGLQLKEQLGLVPLGKDETSGLYEFVDVLSGDPPLKDPGTGRFVLTAESGVILVLLPGGRFLQGSQKKDPDGPNYDKNAGDEDSAGGELIEVELAPFFMSKYEMTQAQWLRLEGRNPTFFIGEYAKKTSPVHPADSISQKAATDLLPRFLLELPTEAQWEYACRAGTLTVWSFGDDFSVASRFCNVKDEAFLHGMSNVLPSDCEAIDDGMALASPVGHYEPNGFGLFDMHGNLMEWCKDRYAPSYRGTVHPGDGEQIGSKGGTFIGRGGAFSLRSPQCRSGYRFAAEPSFSSYSQGIRPARRLDR